MNFLAHVQLSHGIAPLITGNLVADAYKGNKHELLPSAIQHGVILHRRIDHFTDTNPAVLELKKILSPYFGRYAGVALDVYFDHFLSQHWELFNKTKLIESIPVIHAHLTDNLEHVNDESKVFLERLISYNWLTAYERKGDLEQIFNQMSRRFNVDVLKNSMLPLEKHYFEIEATFIQFYPLLISESKHYIEKAGF